MAAVTAKFDELEVPEDKRPGLLSALESGRRWNSFDGSAPVSSEQDRESGATVITERFADGSAIRTTVEDAPTPSLPPVASFTVGGSVTGCKKLPSQQGWIRRGDCEVAVEMVTVMMGFNADYGVKSGAGRIERV